jgi:hypothetical protein
LRAGRETIGLVSEPGLKVVIGTNEDDQLVITVTGRMHPGRTDYWDGNWLVTPLELRVGGFTGRIMAALRANELLSFRDQLRTLYDTLTGQATLDSIEHWIHLDFEGDGAGHVAVKGMVKDEPGMGNTLRLSLDLDQTFLPMILEQLDEVDRAFPVLGHP